MLHFYRGGKSFEKSENAPVPQDKLSRTRFPNVIKSFYFLNFLPPSFVLHFMVVHDALRISSQGNADTRNHTNISFEIMDYHDKNTTIIP